MNIEELKEIAGLLQSGDQVEIAKKSGLTPKTVSAFFTTGKVSEETEMSILNAFSDVIEDRNKRKRTVSNRINNLLKS